MTRTQVWQQQLKNALTDRTTVVGVGNRLRGDDGAGPLVVDLLQNRSGVACVDAGEAPENYLEKIVRTAPDTILVVDAVDFRGAPGEVRVFRAGEVSTGTLSTHAPSLGLLQEYLRQRTGARVWIVAIQPSVVGLGQLMSRPVRAAAERVAKTLSL